MAFAPAQDPMIGSSTLEDELAAAAAHAGMPVEPPSPGSQAAPPGLDMAQLLAQMEAMQKELNKLKGENMKFRFLFATDDQPEQPQPPGPQQFPMTPPKATVEEETPPPAPWSQSWDPWTKRPDPWDQADGGWHQGDNNWRTTTEWLQDSGNSWASWIPQNPQTS